MFVFFVIILALAATPHGLTCQEIDRGHCVSVGCDLHCQGIGRPVGYCAYSGGGCTCYCSARSALRNMTSAVRRRRKNHSQNVVGPRVASAATPTVFQSRAVAALDPEGAILKVAESWNTPADARVAFVIFQGPIQTSGALKHLFVSVENATAALQEAFAELPGDAETKRIACSAAVLMAKYADAGQCVAQAFRSTAGVAGQLQTIVVATMRSDKAEEGAEVVLAAVSSKVPLRLLFRSIQVRKCHRCAKCGWTGRCCCHTATEQRPRGMTLQETQQEERALQFDQHRWILTAFGRPEPPALARIPPPPSQAPVSDLMRKMKELMERIKARKGLANLPILRASKRRSQRNQEDVCAATYVREHIESLSKHIQRTRATNVPLANVRAIVESFVSPDGNFRDAEAAAAAVSSCSGRTFEKVVFGDGVEYVQIVAICKGHDLADVDILRLQVRVAFRPPEQERLYSSFSVTSGEDWPDDVLDEDKDLVKALRRVASGAEPRNMRDMAVDPSSGGGGFLGSVNGVSNALQSVASAWSAVANAFKTKKSQTFELVKQLGFERLEQRTALLSVTGLPRDKVPEFLGAVATLFKLPQDQRLHAVMMAMEWGEDAGWMEDHFVFSDGAGAVTSLIIVKRTRAKDGKADFVFLSSASSFVLAPDLLIVTTTRSVLGGIYESSKTEIREYPHTLTLNETVLLQEFFRVSSYAKLARELGVPFPVSDMEGSPAVRAGTVFDVSNYSSFFAFGFFGIVAAVLFVMVAALVALLVKAYMRPAKRSRYEYGPIGEEDRRINK